MTLLGAWASRLPFLRSEGYRQMTGAASGNRRCAPPHPGPTHYECPARKDLGTKVFPPQAVFLTALRNSSRSAGLSAGYKQGSPLSDGTAASAIIADVAPRLQHRAPRLSGIDVKSSLVCEVALPDLLG